MQTTLNFIGSIRTPYRRISECPDNIQFNGPLCELKINDEYRGELQGLKEGDYVMVLYWLGRPRNGKGFMPVNNENEPGTFAMRTPYRPNPIGVAIVPIESMAGGTIFVRGLDCLDKTELLDIKPPIFREVPEAVTEISSLKGCECGKQSE